LQRGQPGEGGDVGDLRVLEEGRLQCGQPGDLRRQGGQVLEVFVSGIGLVVEDEFKRGKAQPPLAARHGRGDALARQIMGFLCLCLFRIFHRLPRSVTGR